MQQPLQISDHVVSLDRLSQHTRSGNTSYSYATGKRKSSIARIWVKSGSGKKIINGNCWQVYFKRHALQVVINQPLILGCLLDKVDIIATVRGGGLSGQAGAIRHGISRALTLWDPALRSKLRSSGLLTRDSRVVERKKYGRAKARKRFQFSKR